MSARSNLTSRAALLIFAVALSTMVFALGEFVIRNIEQTRTAVPGTLPLIYYRHVTLGRALRPGADYFGWVHVNSRGFRGAEFASTVSPGVTRLMAVGGSTTFDTCVRDDDAWPVQLQKILNDGNSGRRWEVINAGVPGYGLLQQIIRLQSEFHMYRPDAILLYVGHNDLARSLQIAASGGDVGAGLPGEAPSVSPWTGWLTHHSLLYNKVMLRLGAMRSVRRKRRTPAQLTEQDWNLALESAEVDFRRGLKSFLLIARGLGIPVVVVEVAQVHGTGPADDLDSDALASWSTAFAAPPHVTISGYRRFGRVSKAIADSLGAPFIGTESTHVVGSANYCPRDPIHFSALGSERLARGLATVLPALLTTRAR